MFGLFFKISVSNFQSQGNWYIYNFYLQIKIIVQFITNNLLVNKNYQMFEKKQPCALN
jgi:hypothetical protein